MLHGQTRYNVKSRFFDELPEETLRWITPRQRGFGSGFARTTRRLGGGSGWARRRPRQVAAAACARPRRGGHGLRPGQGVFHSKFGEGVIVTLEGSGADARAQVRFGRHGTKWLALAIARLTPIA